MTNSTLSDESLRLLSLTVGKRLAATGKRLVTAESCTGGWIGKVLTDVPGSSAWFSGGAIVYSNELKQRVLGVDSGLLAQNGAVSEIVVRAMAEGALIRLGADLAIAVSGVAGPDGGSSEKPVGTVWFAWSSLRDGRIESRAERQLFSGNREQVRRATVAHALSRLAE